VTAVNKKLLKLLHELDDRAVRGVSYGVAQDLFKQCYDEIELLNGQLANRTAELIAAQNEAGPCIKDAERYRWLRANNHYEGRVCIEIADADDSCTVAVWHDAADLDPAIDEAMGVTVTVPVAPEAK
jgi:hypothetical protein